MLKIKNFLVFSAVLICVLFTTCETEMGLGDPVDVIAPLVFIDTPKSGQFLSKIALGSPITITGRWFDDTGVTSIAAQVIDRSNNSEIEIQNPQYSIDPSGLFTARIVINNPSPNNQDYLVRIIAFDKFGNKGGTEVNIRIEIIPPWIEGAQIIRHPNTGLNFIQDELYEIDYYRNLGYDQQNAYRDIKYEDLDKFQNESFSLQAEVKQSFSEVSHSRLFIYDEYGNRLTETGLVPAYREGDRKLPQWDITKADLVNLPGGGAAGAHYIYFEVHAWSQASWPIDAPNANNSETGREEIIGGTVWYPESDIPKVHIDTSNEIGNILRIDPGSSLSIEFYDDDRISEIYAGFVTKADFDTLRGGLSEQEYLDSLAIAANSAQRAAALQKFIPGNSSANQFTPEGIQNRWRNIVLPAGTIPGEYRLIALIKENKTTAGSGFVFDGTIEKWGVYPLVRIQVQDMSEPIIIITQPEIEGSFPNLTAGGGERFTITGYVLDEAETESVQFAWIPNTLPQSAHNTSTLNANFDLQKLNPSLKLVNSEGVFTTMVTSPPQKTILNGREYWRTDFSHTLHIVDDFTYNSALENADKHFYIRAVNINTSLTSPVKNFRLGANNALPVIQVTSHQIGSNHDRETDLTLRMIVSAGANGVKIKDGSQIIRSEVTADDAGFSSPTLPSGNEFYRTVTSAWIKGNTSDGDPKTFIFEAENILGQKVSAERTIILSNKPIIESIICTNGSGTYGIGTVLRFEVSYSLPVMVTDAVKMNNPPKLRLYTAPSAGGAGYYREALFSQAIGNTAVFTYTVQEGDIAELLHTALDSIDQKTGIISYDGQIAISDFPDHTNSLQNNTQVTLDGIRPSIVRASFRQLDGFTNHSYFNNGRTITLKLWTSEQVRVSGTPVAHIRYGANTLPATFTRISTENIGGTVRYILEFQHRLNVPSVALTQLSWGTPWLDLTGGSIEDMVGNAINIAAAALPTGNNLTGGASSPYPTEQASIKTTIPAAPTYSFHATAAAATAGTGAIPITNNQLLTSGTVYLRVVGDGQTGTVIRYSAQTPDTDYNPNHSSPGVIQDQNYANRFLTTYQPSMYSVTARQIDIAGNTSPSSASTSVTLNSRWPELTSVDFGVQDGSYRLRNQDDSARIIPIRLNFSGAVRFNGAPSVTMVLNGGGANITVTGTPTIANSATESTMITLNWNLTSTAVTSTMQDIKVVSVSFTNIRDAYGNDLRAYSGTEAESSGNPNRPISNASSFQINRPNVIIRPVGPIITSSNPAQITANNTEGYNGAIISGNTITLTFDAPVTKVQNKYIVIRPYGEWAIPPVLSTEQFDDIYSKRTYVDNTNPFNPTPASLDGETVSAYRRRLSDVDANGLPVSGSEYDSGYNLYVKNTHGIVNGPGGFARPDTTTKYVLHFDTDLYTSTNANNLRAVFNAARWNWQTIHAGSSYVTANGTTTVTIRIPETLDNGRIWEVLIEEGAFRDAAGNGSAQINAGQYRFWTDGTAVPVIRVEKVSYDGNNYNHPSNRNVALGYVTAANATQRPPVDTRVRIDCETPGANIRYEVIRTQYYFGNSDTTPINPLTNTSNTDNAFFGPNSGINTSGTAGYTRNSIGNDDVAQTANLTNGFFNKLLVPNRAQTGTATITNGAIPYTTLTGLRTGLQDWNQATASNTRGVYRTASGTAYTFNTNTGQAFFFVGNLWRATIPAGGITSYPEYQRAASDTDTNLFNGRRDYIVAVARKGAITGANDDARKYAGPQLAWSGEGMEGVYKTTLLYRDPQRGGRVARVLVQGFDIPVFPVVAGFPLRDADSTNASGNDYDNLFSKSAYRTGGSSLTTVPTTDATSNHIWVSWEIVTDWYQKGKGFTTAGNYLNNDQLNANSVAATYGGVIYRYRQNFYN